MSLGLREDLLYLKITNGLKNHVAWRAKSHEADYDNVGMTYDVMTISYRTFFLCINSVHSDLN